MWIHILRDIYNQYLYSTIMILWFWEMLLHIFQEPMPGYG